MPSVCYSRVHFFSEYVQTLLNEALRICPEKTFKSVLKDTLSPDPPPMTAIYPREPKDILIARRMLRFTDGTQM